MKFNVNPRSKTKNLIISAFFVCLGIVVPLLSAHSFGVPGTVLLPMHLPVLLSGLICGPLFGALTGVLTPLLSSLLTGMPPVFPMLPIMLVELTCYGFFCGLFYKKLRLNLFVSLIASMVLGRLGYALVFQVLFSITNGKLRAANVAAAISTGVVGILIQLVLVPVIVASVNKFLNHNQKSIISAIDKINKNQASCILVRNNEQIYTANGRGVTPLLTAYTTEAPLMENAVLVDKIIGKGAAIIAVLGKVKVVYTQTISQAAKDYLLKNDITVHYNRCVSVISNRQKTGICPIEQAVLNENDPVVALNLIIQKIDDLKNNKNIS